MNEFALRSIAKAVQHEEVTPFLVRLGVTPEETTSLVEAGRLIERHRQVMDAWAEARKLDSGITNGMFSLIHLSTVYPQSDTEATRAFRWDDIWLDFHQQVGRVRPAISERTLRALSMLVSGYKLARSGQDIDRLHAIGDDDALADAVSTVWQLISYELQGRLWASIAAVASADELATISKWGDALLQARTSRH